MSTDHIANPGGFKLEAFEWAPNLTQQLWSLAEGRHDLPLRALTGRVVGTSLRVERLLTYAQHVAVMGMIASGFHRQEAALAAATGDAGAREGSLAEFEIWAKRKRAKSQPLLAITLPDGCPWVTWFNGFHHKTSLVAMVCGWQDGLCALDETLWSSPVTLQ